LTLSTSSRAAKRRSNPVFSVSKEPDAGRALIKFLVSPAARDTLVKSGLDPIPASATN
jgi:molybdate transport system substrate-binding protein